MFRYAMLIVFTFVLTAAPLVAADEADAPGAELAIPEIVRFNRDIRPILSNNCFACHGPDARQRKAELRLDSKEGLFADLGLGLHVIVPGKPAASEVYQRITSDDKTERMPPAKFKKELTARQVALIKKWIEQGAEWEGHWAFIPPAKQPLPKVSAGDWPVNAIDYFVLSRVERAGYEPSKGADRRTLIRRLSFDLTGLPPTPDEVEAFINDKSPGAYEKLVDRLLASPHYGERMAVYWLDLARYADSIGYHSDNPRDVWMYRDYIIKAFNDNYRFDRFTIEQLAGDLLDNATNEQKVASGYNRLLQTTQEGGAQAKEYIAKYAADRVRNVSEVWMSATMACAECHDHKFDPFTTREFYSLASFFADIKETAVGGQEQTPIPTPEFEAKLKAMDAQISAAEAALVEESKDLGKQQVAWEKKLLAQLGKNEIVDFAWVDDQRVPNGNKEGAWHYVTKDQGPVFSGTQSRKQTDGGLVQHFVIGAKDTIKLEAGNKLFAYVYLDPKSPPQQVMLQWNDGSWEHRAWWGEDRIPFGGNGTNGPNHRKQGELPKTGQWARLEVDANEVGLKPGSVLNGIAFTQWGGTVYWDKAGVSRNGVDLPAELIAVLKLPRDKRSKEQAEALAKHYAAVAPQLREHRDHIAALKKQKDELQKQSPRTLISVSVSPRTMRVLPRGNWLDDSGEEVAPATPGVLPALGVEGRRATRLDLAKWLLSRDHPLVARTFVNRLWKLYFGHGVARTLEDMGVQGQWPTHPDLLDWLAVEFIESGWDVKRLVKLMVTSATYQQSSVPSSALAASDPYNKLYARQSRWRLDAEFVRDNALSISGLLVADLGGPSVKPYQPAGYWQHLNFPQRKWDDGKGDELYRRGLYTWWQRSFLHPSLLAFDAVSREECTAERPRSNTPQQALALLNDPTYVEAARVFAQRVLAQPGDAKARLKWAYQKALQRDPVDAEVKVLAALLDKHLSQYKGDAKAADALLAVGDAPVPPELDQPTLAAWTNVTRVILNLHETITRQ